MTSLPQTGQMNWGVPLNNYITNSVLAVANSALTSINNHTAAADPHGDRAYAANLVSPITSGTNLPSGYVRLDAGGHIPSSLMPPGSAPSNIYDARRDYGATGNGSTDDSAALQAALTACSNGGGGEVWVPAGTYAIGTQLVIGTGTWLHLSPGAVIRRIIPTGGSAPSVMLSNVSFATGTGTPATGNMLVSGGQWDAVSPAGLTSSCTPIMFVQATFAAVIQTYFNGVAGNPAVEINGCKYITLRDNVFTGSALSAGGGLVPAVRLNSTSTDTTPAGMASRVYNNATCADILVEACSLVTTGTAPSTNRFLGADLYHTGASHNLVTVTGCATSGNTTTDVYPPVDYTHVAQGLSFGNLWNVTAGNPILDLTTSGNMFLGPTAAGAVQPTIYVSGKLAYATGYPGSIVPETWHRLPLPSGWTDHSTSGADGFRYKQLPFNAVMLQVDLSAPAVPPSDNTTIGNMPGPATPGVNEAQVVLSTSNLVASGAQSSHMVIQTNGLIKCWGITASAVVQGVTIYPLD